jgi:hypothetical protein
LVLLILLPLVAHCAEAGTGRHRYSSGSNAATAALFNMIYLLPPDKDVNYGGAVRPVSLPEADVRLTNPEGVSSTRKGVGRVSYTCREGH